MTGKDDLLREFGARVRGRRKECWLSQEELAYQSGMHRTYVSSVEHREHNTALVNIVALEAALGVNVGVSVSDLAHTPLIDGS